MRWILVVLALSCASPASAKWPAPRVRGSDESAEVVRRSLATLGGRREPTAWMQRAWTVLRDEGWVFAQVGVDSTAGGRALVLRSGPRTRIETLELRGADPDLSARWAVAAGLREGNVLRPGAWPAQARRGLRALAERGHLFASVTLVSREVDPESGATRLVVLVRPGERSSLREVVFEGATSTRASVLTALSGLRSGEELRESDLERARRRLEARDLVLAVESLDVERVAGEAGEVDARIRLRQPDRTGRIAAAVGVVDQGGEEGTRLSGSVDLALLDLFGTARRFEGSWSDDGRARNRLDLSYLEPLLLGSPLDLSLGMGQRHEDEAYDTIRFDVGVLLPPDNARHLALTLGADRTTFLGEEGRLRWRRRLGVEVGVAQKRPLVAGAFASFDTRIEAARVTDTRKAVSGEEERGASVTQTLIEADGGAGWAFGPTWALRAHGHWRSTETDELPLPRSEQWALGGATTVRGYREDQFLGERVAWGGLEATLGPRGSGQAYLFFDVGWTRRTVEDESGTRAEEDGLQGFGVGLRSPTALGALDLSLGFAGGLSLDRGKLHLSLVRSF